MKYAIFTCVHCKRTGGWRWDHIGHTGMASSWCVSPCAPSTGRGHGTPGCRSHTPGPGGEPTVQYSTVQYSTVQYSTVQYSTVNLSWSRIFSSDSSQAPSCSSMVTSSQLSAQCQQQCFAIFFTISWEGTAQEFAIIAIRWVLWILCSTKFHWHL